MQNLKRAKWMMAIVAFGWFRIDFAVAPGAALPLWFAL
jgi:hypothetical protein